ncbi:MAG: hypothetical protein ABSF84_02355 [Acidimicrobiales bacterium]
MHPDQADGHRADAGEGDLGYEDTTMAQDEYPTGRQDRLRRRAGHQHSRGMVR